MNVQTKTPRVQEEISCYRKKTFNKIIGYEFNTDEVNVME